eukprot:1922369-Pyramimonas_sp.AAC.1
MQLQLPPGTIPLLRMCDGFEDFDPALEVLDTDKPVIGSTVAPKDFSMKLDEVMREAKLVPTQAQPLVYVRHDEHQYMDGNTQKTQKKLAQMVGAHVDDLKGCDPQDGKVHNELIKILEKHFGKLKDQKYGKFECC